MLLLAVLLAACGGDPAPAPAPERGLIATVPAGTPAPTGPGELRAADELGTVTAAAVAEVVATPGVRVPAIRPVYDVRTLRLSYLTRDGQGREILASGLLALPLKSRGTISPVVSVQHGTIFRDAEAPSNNATATEPAVVMASLGYIVLAADYVGYGVSKGAPHPYLLAAPTAAAVLDLLGAADAWGRRQGVHGNGQLFLVGYSEGGYATMAAHRAMQETPHRFLPALVGSAPAAGPFDVNATLDELLRRVRRENPALALLVEPGLLRFLGSSVRREVRDRLLEALLPDDADVVFQTEFIDRYLADDRKANERDANVHDWRPDAPVRLFHGRDDQTVPFVASQNALDAMHARGAPDVTLQECVAEPAGHLPCVLPYWSYMLSQMALVVRDL